MNQVLHGDCLDVLRTLEDNSVDSIVTDPPAGIAFMGKTWDEHKGGRDIWIAWLTLIMREALRVLKPGAHAFVWALPRTSHWTALALEDAGFEVKDAVSHIFGSGFPKSKSMRDIGRPELGSALKPSHEVWWLVRKPLAEKSIAANVLQWGTGAINVDASRIGTTDDRSRPPGKYSANTWDLSDREHPSISHPQGRFPSNTLLSHTLLCQPRGEKRVKGDGHNSSHVLEGKQPDTYGFTTPHRSKRYQDEEGMETVAAYDCSEDCPVFLLDQMSGVRKSGAHSSKELDRKAHGMFAGGIATPDNWYGDTGGASRYYQCFPPDDMPPFIYTSKASRAERNRGCEALPERSNQDYEGRTGQLNSQFRLDGSEKKPVTHTNSHPTVKPVKLLNYLIRMITPLNGIVLDMFAGSGSTGVACVQNGFRYILIEQEQEYIDIIHARLAHAHKAMPVQEQEDGEYLCSEDCPVRILGEQSGERKSSNPKGSTSWSKGKGTTGHDGWQRDAHANYKPTEFEGYGDTGTAARFFKTFPPEPSLWDVAWDVAEEAL